MVRPRIFRRIKEVSLSLEEIKAVRLNDFSNLEQTKCAKNEYFSTKFLIKI